MGMDLQIDTDDPGLIDRHLWAWTYRQTLMIMDLQIDTYGHGLRQTLMSIYLQMDTYGYGLIDRNLWAWTWTWTWTWTQIDT